MKLSYPAINKRAAITKNVKCKLHEAWMKHFKADLWHANMTFITITKTIVFMLFASQQSIQTSFNTAGTLFYLEIRGHRFEDSIGKTFKGYSLPICAALCHHSEGCNSFQYHKALQSETDAICELVEPVLDKTSAAMNPDFNVYSRISQQVTATETIPEALAKTDSAMTETAEQSTEMIVTSQTATETTVLTTTEQTTTAVPSKCAPLVPGQLQCNASTYAASKTSAGCTLTSNTGDPDMKFVLYHDEILTWNSAKTFCTGKKQHLPYIKDQLYECILMYVFSETASLLNFQDKGYPVGIRHNSNDNWKFADGSAYTNFPEFYGKPDPDNDNDPRDVLCGFMTVNMTNNNILYRSSDCAITTEDRIKFIPLCTEP